VAALSRELYGRAEGSHATPSEVSLTWAAYPAAAKPMVLDPEIAPKGEFTDAADYRRRFPDGRIGSNPGLSSVEAGQRILEAAVEGMAAEYESWIRDS
jgi:creatinine amidohydrolase